MEIHDLQPLLKSNNNSKSDSNLSSSSTRTTTTSRRRNSLTMASLRRYRCLMLVLIGAIILAGFSFLYRCPDYYCFAQKPSYTIGMYNVFPNFKKNSGPENLKKLVKSNESISRNFLGGIFHFLKVKF